MGKLYTVQPGNTLSEIAENYPGVSYQDIYNANRDILDSPHEIYAGQQLDIPSPGADYSNSYTVQPGNTLSEIAENYPGVSYQDIYNANRDILDSPHEIYAGQQLDIPSSSQHMAKTPSIHDESVAMEIDYNGDGYTDEYYIDSNGDGCVDTAYVDSNGDGYIDTAYVDSNGDGCVDTMMADLDYDGSIDMVANA